MVWYQTWLAHMQVPDYNMEGLMKHIADHRGEWLRDVWNDANLGEAFVYLLEKKSKYSLAVEQLAAMVPIEDFFFEPHPSNSRVFQLPA